jgi:hypothetical protein
VRRFSRHRLNFQQQCATIEQEIRFPLNLCKVFFLASGILVLIRFSFYTRSSEAGELERMTIREWWHRRREQRGRRQKAKPLARVLDEAGIAARVDMVRLEALAEAAYDAMYEARLHGAKNRYEEARYYFDRGIEAAQRARLYEEAARLKRRRDHVGRVYNSQFRYSGGG